MSTTQNVDWDAAANRPSSKSSLRRSGASFVVPATIFFLTWYFGFIVLAGVAPDFMGEKVIEGVTIGYIFALSQFIMVWVLAAGCICGGPTRSSIRSPKRRASGIESRRPPSAANAQPQRRRPEHLRQR